MSADPNNKFVLYMDEIQLRSDYGLMVGKQNIEIKVNIVHNNHTF